MLPCWRSQGPSLYNFKIFDILDIQSFSDSELSRLGVTSIGDRVWLWSKFALISPSGRVWAFICKNLHSIYMYLRMLCAKFGWKWPSGSGEFFFFNFVNVFSLFQYNFTFLLLSPLGEKPGLLFEEGCFVSRLVEIGPVVGGEDENVNNYYRQRTNFRQKIRLL